MNDEIRMAISARIKRAADLIEAGYTKEGLDILKNLLKVLPAPEFRHLKAAHNGTNPHAKT